MSRFGARRQTPRAKSDRLSGLVRTSLRPALGNSPPCSGRLSAVLEGKYGGELGNRGRRVAASTAEKLQLPQGGCPAG